MKRGFGIMGVATKYAADVTCPVFIIQSERYHASVSSILKVGSSKSQGLSVYKSLENTPFKKFNEESANIDADEIDDFFPAPLWGDGKLLADYFIKYVEPLLK